MSNNEINRSSSISRFSSCRTVLFLFVSSLCAGLLPQASFGQDPLNERQQAFVERLIVRGMTRLYLEDYEGASEAFQEALRISPEDPALLASMSQAKLGSGELDAAEFFLDGALKTDPENTALWELAFEIHSAAGNTPALVEDRRQIALHDPDNLRARLELVSLLMRLEQYDSALSTLDEAIAFLGENALLLNEKANVAERLGRTSEFEQTLYKLIALNPKEPDHRMRLSSSLIRREAWNEAETVLSETLTLYPGDEEASVYFADVLDHLGRTDEAADLLEEMRARNTDSPGHAVSDFSDSMNDDMDSLVEWIENHPDDLDAIQVLADKMVESDRPLDAATNYRLLVSREPRRLDAWTAGISSYLLAEDTDSAMRMIEDALTFFPGYIPIRLLQAETFLKTGHVEEALRIIRDVEDKTLSAEDRVVLERLRQQIEAM